MEQVHHPNIFPPPSQPWATTNLFFSLYSFIFSRMLYNSVQFSHSVVSDSLQPHGLQHAYLSITNSQSLHKLMSIELVMSSNHLILCHPLLLPPSIFPSIRVFSNEWSKYWSFSFSTSLSNEYSGFISLGLTGLISLQSKGLSRVFSSTSLKASVL